MSQGIVLYKVCGRIFLHHFFFVLFHWVPRRETSQRLIIASVA